MVGILIFLVVLFLIIVVAKAIVGALR